MPIDDLFTQIDSRFNSELTGLRATIKTNITTASVTNKIRSVYDDSSGSNLLKLEYTHSLTTNLCNHDIAGLVNLFEKYLVTDIGANSTIPKLDYSDNNDIDTSYSNLSSMNKTINDNKNTEKLIRNDITKTTNNINLQYYESVIVFIILIIFIAITIVFNLNNKKQYVKYLIPILILLFVIIHLFNNLYIQIEPFNSGPNLFGFDEFTTDLDSFIAELRLTATVLATKYDSKKSTIPPDVNNYYDVFKYLTGKDIYVSNVDDDLNKLITSYAILDFMHKFKNIYKDQGLANKERNKQYINEINRNLKTEVDKYQHINALVKRSVKNTKNHYNNLYLTTLYYRDIVYLLIYLTIISILLNVIFIEFGFNYSDKRVLGLYIFLFILGIVIYSYRYLIRVKTNPRNRYF
jgi:hypothetical protein